MTRHINIQYSSEQMFDLVNDVEQYPYFLPSCVMASIEKKSYTEMQATLVVAYLGIQTQLITKNRFEKNKWITMELIQGPIKHLFGQWTFTAMTTQDCRIEFKLMIQLHSNLINRLFHRLIEEYAQKMVDAFIQRAHQIYGD